MGRDKLNKKVKFAGLIALAATFLVGAGAFAINFFSGATSEPIVAEAATASEIATSWANFIKGTGATWTLPDNWTAPQTNYVGKFGTDVLAYKDGALYIPEGRTVTINLNGKTLNRNCAQVSTYNGCVIYNDGNLTISGSGTITGGNNSEAGGGIVNNGTLTIGGGTITGNKTVHETVGGGGIYSPEESNLTITGGTISNNTANWNGGGVYSRGNLSVKGGTFSGNSSGNNGGAIYYYPLNGTPKFEMTSGSFTGNNAKTSGGAVLARVRASTTISGITVTNNMVETGAGGGMYFEADAGTITFTGVTVTGNTAFSLGGGLRVYKASAIIGGDSKFNNNQARYGGGVAWEGDGDDDTFTMSNTTINGNKMYAPSSGDANGGGIRATNGTVNMNAGTKITNNTYATGYSGHTAGGGIFAYKSTITLRGAIIENNCSTRYGGGAYFTDCETLITGNTEFNWNYGIGNGTNNLQGAGVYTAGSGSFDVNGATFYKNGYSNKTTTIATWQAGAIFFSRSGTITKATFDGNASNEGSAFVFCSPTTIGKSGGNNADVVIKNGNGMNSAALVWRTSVVINSCTFENNSANYGFFCDTANSRITINGGLFQNNGKPNTANGATNAHISGGVFTVSSRAAEAARTLTVNGGTFTGN